MVNDYKATPQPKSETCPACQGTGQELYNPPLIEMGVTANVCPDCNGTGLKPDCRQE